MEKSTWIAGEAVDVAAPDGELVVRAPADLDDLVGVHPWSLARVDDAVAVARAAQPAWDALGHEARAAHLRAFRDALAAREERLAQAITREMGKALRESRAEAKALVAKVDITLGEGAAFARDWSLEGGRMECRYRPHGVLAVIGPFNFPLHLAHGHVAPALYAGNAVVLKPSELTPGCASLYAEAARDAGLPPGVLGVAQGDGRAGARLASHDDVDGVLFTGSYAVGTRILRDNAARPGRMLALEMGGRNAAVVLDDAPFEKALHDVLVSAFSTAGQRCTCVSRLVVTRGVAARFVDALAGLAARVRVGDPLDPEVFHGPLASEAALARFEGLQREADAEGSRCVRAPEPVTATRDGRALRGCWAAPRVRWVNAAAAGGPYRAEELFGPDLAVWVADDLEHAAALANDSAYGLAAGVWTRDEARFEALARRLRVGCITWNAPTVGASSRLPFGGLGRSGNHRPAGVLSSLYCAYPLAVTRGAEAFDARALAPGLPREGFSGSGSS